MELLEAPAVFAMQKFLLDTARHGDVKMSDTDDVMFLNTIRKKIGYLLTARPTNVAIVSSASEILSQLPLLIKLKRNKKIISIKSDLPAITHPRIAYSTKNTS